MLYLGAKLNVNTGELASIIGVSKGTLRSWINNEDLNMPYKKEGRYYIYNVPKVYEWIKTMSKSSNPHDISRWRKYRRMMFNYITTHYDAYEFYGKGYGKGEIIND